MCQVAHHQDAEDGLVWDLRASLLWGAPDTWRWRDRDITFFSHSYRPFDCKLPPSLNFQTSITPAPPPALDYLGSSILSILLLQANGIHLRPLEFRLISPRILLSNGWRSIVPCAFGTTCIRGRGRRLVKSIKKYSFLSPCEKEPLFPLCSGTRDWDISRVL